MKILYLAIVFLAWSWPFWVSMAILAVLGKWLSMNLVIQ